MKNPYKRNKNFDILQDKVWYARAKFDDKEITAVINCLTEFQLSPAKYTFEFEKQIAKIFDKDFGVMTNSGSSALLLAAELLDIKEGDEIITQASGFPTTINPFLFKGAKVILVDVDPYTLAPKMDDLEAAITSKTKAIIVAHIWGATLDMPTLHNIALRHNIPLIEDSCDSLGATIDGNPTGLWSDMSICSFYPSHVITAGGGGGMLCLKTGAEEKKARIFRDWGREGTDSENVDERFGATIDGIPYDAKFTYGVMGWNLKACEMQAAFGLAQLKKLDEFNKIRNENYIKLTQVVRERAWHPVMISAQGEVKTSWLTFPFLVDSNEERQALAKHFEKNSIQTRPILGGSLKRHNAYKDNPKVEIFNKIEGADEVAKRGLGIGLHPDIDDIKINHVRETIAKFKNG